jgi:hypothetical protein
VKVGLISDTHGLLRPEALAALRGCEHIIHAGDIGDASILEALREIAPVTAVRGNNDRASWAADIPDTAEVTLDGARVYVIHDLNELDRARAKGCGAVIAGHSHKPGSQTRDGVLYVNPGSAGPRRFSLPISLGFLEIDGAQLDVELLTLG